MEDFKGERFSNVLGMLTFIGEKNEKGMIDWALPIGWNR